MWPLLCLLRALNPLLGVRRDMCIYWCLSTPEATSQCLAAKNVPLLLCVRKTSCVPVSLVCALIKLIRIIMTSIVVFLSIVKGEIFVARLFACSLLLCMSSKQCWTAIKYFVRM